MELRKGQFTKGEVELRKGVRGETKLELSRQRMAVWQKKQQEFAAQNLRGSATCPESHTAKARIQTRPLRRQSLCAPLM